MTQLGSYTNEDRGDERARPSLQSHFEPEWLNVTLFNLSDAVIATDRESIVTFINPVAESLTGWSAAEAMGRPLETVFQVVDQEARGTLGNMVSRASKPCPAACEGIRKVLQARDGRERFIDDRVAPIRDQQRRLLGAVRIFREIGGPTSPRQYEEAVLRAAATRVPEVLIVASGEQHGESTLKECQRDASVLKLADKPFRPREQQLADFFENASIGLHWVGADGTILRANRTELDLLGYSREEYVGRHIAEFHVDQEVIDDILARLQRGETLIDYPARMRSKDGSIRDVVISSNVLFEDGKFVHTRCFTRDVTEQKSAEKALRESERRFRQVVHRLPAAIYTCDASGYVTLFNDAAVELWGRRPNIGEDKWCGSWKIYSIDGAPIELEECPMAVAMRECRRVRDQEIIIERTDGRRRHVLPYPEPITDDAGNLTGAVNMLVDVTERKEAEQALRDSEQRLRLALEAGRMGTWEWKIAENKVTWSPSLEIIHGLEVGTFDGTFEAYQRDIHPEDREKVKNAIVRALEGTDTYHVEYRIIWPDGSLHWVEGRGKLFQGDFRSSARMIGVCTDITDRKHTEAALRAKEAELELIAETTPLILTRCSRDLRHLFVNRAAAGLFGRTPEQVIGKPIREVMGAKAFAQIRPYVEQVLRGESVEFEEEIPYDAVGPRWVHATYTPNRDELGDVVGWVASIVDITDRKRTESALRESEERFSRFMQHLPGLAWIKDVDGRYVYANDAATKVFQRSQETLYGKTDREIFPQETASQFMENDHQAVASSAGVQVVETLQHGDGTIHHSIVNKFPIPGPDGQPTLVGGMAVDITDRKRAEEALLTSEERFRSMANITPAMIWTASPDGEITWSSDRWFEYTGISRDDNPRDWPEVLHPDDVERCLQAWNRALKEGTEYEVEVRNRRYDGAYRWFVTRATPIRDAEGRILEWYGSTTDIHDCKHAEQALRESEERYRAVVESQSEMLCRFRTDGSILFVNGAYARARGTTPEALVGSNFWEFVDRKDRAAVRAMLEQLRPDAPEVRIENRFETMEGTRWTLWTNRGLVFDADGRATEAQSSGIDITDRKQAEEALREHSAEVQTLLQTLPIGVFFAHDPQCHRISANRAGYEMLRMSAHENLSKSAPLGEQPTHFRTYREGLEIPTERLPVQRAARGELVRNEEVAHVFADGKVSHLLISAAPLHDDFGQVRGAVASVLDVSERKQLEQSLRFLAEASKSLSSLVDYKSTLQQVAGLAVPGFADWCAVHMLDADGTLAQLAVAHVDPDKVRLAEELYRRFPSQPDDVHGAMKVLRTGESELVAEITDSVLVEAAKDDDHLQVLRELGLKSFICVPLRAKGSTHGAITFVSAESGRRYKEVDLALAEDLAHRAAIAIENARLYQEIREAHRRKDEFLAMLAHELRNPLAPIRNGIDILAMEHASNHETIGLMREQVQHLVRLVDDLLDVSRIMRGRIELRKERVELSALIKRSVEAVRPQIESQGQQFVYAPPDQPIWLDADPVRLVQIIENLLNNAVKYTDAGGRIELSARLLEGQAVIRVEDTGIGIEVELLPHLFDLFTQSSRSLDRSQGGLGIGLTLVQRLVDMHEGTISAHSDGPGKGSKFILRLPVIESVPQTEKIDELPRISLKRRILVVDDNVGAARMLSMLLTKLGDNEVEVAHEGESALAIARELQPEIILLDIGLPGMDGYEVARTIRQSREGDNVFLVALTGYGQEEDRRRSMAAGFDKHLVKPVETTELRNLLAELQ